MIHPVLLLLALTTILHDNHPPAHAFRLPSLHNNKSRNNRPPSFSTTTTTALHDSKKEYLSIVNEAWDAFFSSSKDKEDYLQMALRAWDDAKSDRSTVEYSKKDDDDDESNSSEEDGESNVDDDGRRNPRMQPTLFSVFDFRGQNNDDARSSSSSSSDSKTSTSSTDTLEESIPYGLRKGKQYNRVKSVLDEADRRRNKVAADSKDGTSSEPFFVDTLNSKKSNVSSNNKLKGMFNTKTGSVVDKSEEKADNSKYGTDKVVPSNTLEDKPRTVKVPEDPMAASNENRVFLARSFLRKLKDKNGEGRAADGVVVGRNDDKVETASTKTHHVLKGSDTSRDTNASSSSINMEKKQPRPFSGSITKEGVRTDNDMSSAKGSNETTSMERDASTKKGLLKTAPFNTQSEKNALLSSIEGTQASPSKTAPSVDSRSETKQSDGNNTFVSSLKAPFTKKQQSTIESEASSFTAKSAVLGSKGVTKSEKSTTAILSSEAPSIVMGKESVSDSFDSKGVNFPNGNVDTLSSGDVAVAQSVGSPPLVNTKSIPQSKATSAKSIESSYKGNESISAQSTLSPSLKIGPGLKGSDATKAKLSSYAVGGLKIKSGNSATIKAPPTIQTTKSITREGSGFVSKGKTTFGVDGVEMKVGDPFEKKSFERKQPTLESNKSPLFKTKKSGVESKTDVAPSTKGGDTLATFMSKQSTVMKSLPKGSEGMFKAKTSFDGVGLRMKVDGLPVKKALVPKQPAFKGSKMKFPAGLKGSDSIAKTKFGVGGPKMKFGFDKIDKTTGLKQPSTGLKQDGDGVNGSTPQQPSSISLNSGVMKGFKSTLLSGAEKSEVASVAPAMKRVSSSIDVGVNGVLSSRDDVSDKSSESGAFAVKGHVTSMDEMSASEDDIYVGGSIQDEFAANSSANGEEDLEMNTDAEFSSQTLSSADDSEQEIITTDWLEGSFEDEVNFEELLRSVDESSLPLLHIGSRIKSNKAGPAHRGYLVLSKDGPENILPCTTKRPWTVLEIIETAIEERQQAPEDWELQVTTKTLANYFEVEYHCYQKIEEVKQLRILQKRQAEADREKNGQMKPEVDAADSFDLFEVVVPKMLGIYQDDGSSDSEEDEDIWGQPVGKVREWMVFSGGGIDGIESTLNQHVTAGKDDLHHLRRIQAALNLPDWFRFGDVMDAIAKCMVENLVFLSSCNIVHRNINMSNLNCDNVNQRLQLINFGGAVDLDPKEGKRIGLETPPSNDYIPGSIANSLAEDSCATAIVLCQLLFNLMDEASVTNFQQQIKASTYDLDAWLKSQIESTGRDFNPEDVPALEYLGERRGMWGLLKRMIQPNPMKRKLAVESLKELKEILGLRDGSVNWTDDFIVKVATEEVYLETLIDRFGASNEDENEAAEDSDNDRDGTTAESSNHSSSDVSSYSVSRGQIANASRQNKPKKDVYYDITRSKLTSKYPLQKPSALSSLLPRVKSASPPATASERAEQDAKMFLLRTEQAANVYDITRASLGAANPYSDVLPMKAERRLPKGAARLEGDPSIAYDAVARYQASSEKIEEVKRWLLSYLPRLQSQDLQLYTSSLISDGFDSNEMLKTLDDSDLNFMKKGHKRVLTRKLEVERRLDFELDPSSRKRIEMLVGASNKRIGEINRTLSGSSSASSTASMLKDNALVQSPLKKPRETKLESSSQLAYEMFEAEEELEEAKEWAKERNKLAEKRQSESLNPMHEDVSLIKSSQKSYDIVQTGKDLEKVEAWIDEQNLLVERRRLERSNAENMSGRAKPYDIIEAGNELQRIEAWIDEQNTIIQKRQDDKSASSLNSSDASLLNESDIDESSSTNSIKATSPSEYDIIKAGRELEKIKAWIDEQNKLLEQRQVQRSTQSAEQSLLGVEQNTTKGSNDDVSKSSNKGKTKAACSDDEDRSAWYKEQNRLVEERRLARIEAERRIREQEQ